MKMALGAILILGFLLLPGPARAESPEKPLGAAAFLPADNEIPGWTRSEKVLRAANDEELYRVIDGGATLYIRHGFRSYVGQSYKGPTGAELEVHIFDQGDPQNAGDLFENPYAKPGRAKEIADLGEKARIDETPLFCYGVDFVQKGFFVRVIVQDKTDEGLKAAVSFAGFIAKRIQ